MERLGALLLAILLVFGVAHAAECDAGWTGRDCSMCLTDEACAEMTGDPTAQCSQDLEFYPNSKDKTFACTVNDATLANFIVPDSVLVRCHLAGTSNETADMMPVGRRLLGSRALLEEGGEEGDACEISLQLGKFLGGGVVNCEATECTPDGMGITCLSTTCTCVPEDCGSAQVSALVTQVQGEGGLSCGEDGSCLISLKLPGLGNNGIKATCTSAECLVDV